jgi:hypothetical protein
MPQPDNDKLGEVMAETTSAFTRADFLNDEIDHRPALAPFSALIAGRA